MSPQLRTQIYFFVQFLSSAAFHAYGGIWFASLGYSANQIAALSSFPIFVVLIVNIFAGRIADRAKDWRKALIIGSSLSFVPAVGLLFAKEFAPVFIFWSLALIAQSLIVPIADGAALYLTRQGRGQIGTLRSLATAGYIVGLVVTGVAMLAFGGAAFALLFLFFSGLRPLAALALPNFKTEGEHRPPVPAIQVLKQMKAPWLSFPLLGWSIIYSTLQVLSSFLALILSKQGHSEATISSLFAAGALAEAVVFFLFRHVSDKIDLRLMILISCIATVIRMVAMTFDPGLTALFLLQSLHGITYALGFIACISYISRHTPPENAAETQSMFNVLQMVAAIITITFFGSITQHYGSQAFWASAAIAMIGVAFTLVSFWFTPPESTAPGQSG